jgi:hypothetical protein
MRGAVPPLLKYAFIAWCLVKHRDNFTFTFTSVSTTKGKRRYRLTPETFGYTLVTNSMEQILEKLIAA